MTAALTQAPGPPQWLLVRGGEAWSGSFMTALLGAVLLHLLLVVAVALVPPMPKPAPETTLEVLLLKETGQATSQPQPDAALAQRNQAGESAQGDAAVSTFAESTPAAPEQANEDGPTQPPEQAKPAQKPRADRPIPPPEAVASADPLARPDAMTMLPPAPRTPSVLRGASDAKPLPAPDPLETRQTQVDTARILASRGTEIARLTASLEAKSTAYAQRVRRTSVSASTREFRYASYLGAWARKIERIGNLNYPQAAKEQRLYGNLILHVAVRADGSVERIRVVRSSGVELLDQAAIQIVELSAPFSPFPPDIAAETDVLDIIRTWQFMRGDVLGWER